MRNIFKLALALAVMLFAYDVLAQPKPTLPETDRIRLAEAFRIGETLGNTVWAGWNKAPFAVLLITPENEFLVRHPTPSRDFTLIEYDSLLKSKVYFRKRTQDPSSLATFPFNGVPTIVIGQAENTSKRASTPWVVTMLHEHFHQLQYFQPNYFADVNALNLARGDQTGMWMLNYSFPYADSSVRQQFGALTRLLAEALQTKTGKKFSAKVAAYLKERKKFETLLTSDDYRYFSFQVWQEGVARYTEIRVADLAAKKYKPGRRFRLLNDYKRFAEVARETRQDLAKELTTLQLDDYKRVAFYPLGAGEALLLDRINPCWHGHYFVDRFYLDKYFVRTD